MNVNRKVERLLFPCREISELDIIKFPGMSEDEHVLVEMELKNAFDIQAFAFIRESRGESYIEVYFYENYSLGEEPLVSRFIIKDGIRLSEDCEEKFFALARKIPDIYLYRDERLINLVFDVERRFPQWRLNHGNIRGMTDVLMHMYYSSHPGPREILLKAELWNLGLNLDDISCNLLGNTPEDIFGAPLKLLRILNMPQFINKCFDEQQFKTAKKTYNMYSSFLSEYPSVGQWEYLEELTLNGDFAGRKFSRTLYNRLKKSDGGPDLEEYKKFFVYKDNLPVKVKSGIPQLADIWEETSKLEMILYYCNDVELNNLVMEKKRKHFLEYEGQKYKVTLPENSLDFYLEATRQGNCLMEYLLPHATNETTILFIREKSTPRKSFVTMEVSNNLVIKQVYGKNNSLAPSKDVYEFLKEYAQKEWLVYNPYNLITKSINYDRDGGKDNKELKDYVEELIRDDKDFLVGMQMPNQIRMEAI